MLQQGKASELLSIHPSASKPSLLSSFWSIHVQLQQNEKMDLLELRTTAGSQNSLPECFASAQNAAENQNRLRTSKSLGGQDEPSGSSREVSQSGGMVLEQMEITESSTSKVTDWLSHLNTT